ncbi:hypothetical protein JCM10207_001030 [Rhodosporidiobolus poonsookiae]
MLKHESSSPESSGSTPSPPSSDSPPSSGSSPSPPRSAANPPHELVELSLAPLRRDDDRDGRTQRTVPRGKTRDPPVDVPFFLDEDDSDSDDDNEDLPLVSIGPTSSNGEWMRLNLSYSLNSHLVETCNHFASDLHFGGLEFSEFMESLHSSGGRIAELSQDQTLLASVCIFFGTQFTNHSSVLGSRNPAPSFRQLRTTSDLVIPKTTSVGPRRHAPLQEVSRLIREQIELLDYEEGDFPTRMQRLALAWMALEPLHGGHASEHHALFGDLARRAVQLLEDLAGGEEHQEQLLYIAQGLAYEETRRSALLGRPSNLLQYHLHRIFGSPTIPLLVPLPEAAFSSYLFEHPPVRRTTSQEDICRVYDGCDRQLHHVNHVLCFTAASHLADAVQYSWQRLDQLVAFLAQEVDAILQHPDFGALALSSRRRAAAHVNTLVQYALFGLSASWACHVALLRIHASDELLVMSEKHLEGQLTVVAQLTHEILDTFPTFLVACYHVAMRVVTCFEPLSVPLLRGWAEEKPEGRDRLLQTLHFASFYLPGAHLPATPPPRQPHTLPVVADVVISSATFHRRASRLFDQWEAKEEDASPLTDVDHFLIVAGNSDEENPYRKGSAVQTYLLGYEFPSTLMLLGKRKVYFVVSASKAKLLQPILKAEGDKKVEVEILTRSKDEAENKKLFEKIIEVIGEGNKIGTLPKDKMSGKFVTEWQGVLQGSGADLKEVDVALGVSTLLAVKDAEELQNERNAATMTNKLMRHFSDAMSAYIDANKKVTHEKLGEEIEGKLEDNKFWRKLNLGDGFETGFGDWCYSPIIQSGGNYDLKSSAQTDDQRLKPGVILCSLGIRYKSYCSNVGRTFMIDPTPEQEKNYLFLVDLQKFALSELRDGAVGKDVYEKIVGKIQADRPDLMQYWVKTAGFGMGLEFRDAAYPLSAKGTRTLKSDMVFSLTLGFNGIPGKNSQYAVSLVDTVQVGKNGATILSEGMKGKDDIMFYLEEEEKRPSKSAQAKDAPSRRNAAPTAVVKSKLRNENREIDADALNRRKQHQRDLATRRQEEGLEKYSGEGGGGGNNREKQWRRFESYVKDSQLPEAVGGQKIVVDARRLTLILPINGFAVPFHVNTLKSLIKQEEGDYTVLRFMFTTPGAITGKKEDTPFEDPNATFIRGITYRSTDSFRFTELHKEINDLKKAAVKRENERKELADVVEQDKLIELKGKRPIKLTEVQLRPSFDGKRQSGDVEIHSNGIRYQSSGKSEHKLDILFSNIKHLLFQPCDNELIVVLHIHLKSPIMIGKKKAKDVQFFREVSDASFDETGNKKRKRNYHDEDELEAEQEERKRRADLNKYFKAFSDKIAEASNGRVEVDIPFRELGFQGVPFRSNVLLQPTTETLVFLTEPPFLVLTLSEIEIAHLERVQYGLKNFDLVFVFQDFSRPPVHINSIPSNQLDSVKEWLDSVDIPFSEGPVNLNWQAIMKTVNDDPYDFYKEGGWSFLSEKEDERGSSDDSEDASEFEAASSDFAESESDSGSDFSDASEDSDSEAELSDSGEDWSDAENRLAEKEKKKGRGGDSSDDDRGKKSKAKSKSKGKK